MNPTYYESHEPNLLYPIWCKYGSKILLPKFLFAPNQSINNNGIAIKSPIPVKDRTHISMNPPHRTVLRLREKVWFLEKKGTPSSEIPNLTAYL